MYSGQHAESKAKGCLRSIGSLVVMVALVFLLAWLLRTFVFQPYGIPSGSMEDTIEPGDMVFSEKITYYTRDPQPGDIVTFDDPQIPGRTLVKRVIAVEGQTVDLVGGQVVVDGAAIDEPYTQGKPSEPQRSPQNVTFPYTVGEGCLWVMGDNRTNSADSRTFGEVPVSSVTGRAVFTYWPLDHIGPLE